MGDSNKKLFDILEENGHFFETIDFINIERLNAVHQTAFTWTNSKNSLCLAANKQYYNQAVNNPNVIAIITTSKAIGKLDEQKTVLVTNKANELFYFLHNFGIHRLIGAPDGFIKSKTMEGAQIAQTSFISDKVELGKNVKIGHGCYVGDNTVIGDDVEVGPNSVLGVDGLFAKTILGKRTHIKHFGGVKIAAGCKIHAMVAVARSVNYGEYTHLSPQVHLGHGVIVGHDVFIGNDTTVSSGAILAGRSIIGRNCWIGAGAKVSNMCKIGDHAKVRIGSVVISDIDEGVDCSGNFAIDHQKNLRKFTKEYR